MGMPKNYKVNTRNNLVQRDLDSWRYIWTLRPGRKKRKSTLDTTFLK